MFDRCDVCLRNKYEIIFHIKDYDCCHRCVAKTDIYASDNPELTNYRIALLRYYEKRSYTQNGIRYFSKKDYDHFWFYWMRYEDV